MRPDGERLSVADWLGVLVVLLFAGGLAYMLLSSVVRSVIS